MASLNINLSDLPAAESFDPIHDGWYSATIKGAELKTTKDGRGSYIAVQYSVSGPTHAGRVVFGNLNIRNANPEAERIGKQQLGQVMGSIGLATIQDTDQLIGGALMIKVGLSKPQEGYEQRNEVKGFKALEGGAPPMPSQSAATTSAPKAPWAK